MTALAVAVSGGGTGARFSGARLPPLQKAASATQAAGPAILASLGRRLRRSPLGLVRFRGPGFRRVERRLIGGLERLAQHTAHAATGPGDGDGLGQPGGQEARASGNNSAAISKSR